MLNEIGHSGLRNQKWGNEAGFCIDMGPFLMKQVGGGGH